MRLFHWERTVHTELSLSLAVRAGASNNLRHLIRPVQIGETVRFDCGQHNTALYQWSVRYPATSEERPINLILNHRMRTLHGRTLSISNVQVDDSGNYTCQATNLEPIEFELKVYESNASRPECKQSYLAATALRYALTTAALIVLCSALFCSSVYCTVRLCARRCAASLARARRTQVRGDRAGGAERQVRLPGHGLPGPARVLDARGPRGRQVRRPLPSDAR